MGKFCTNIYGICHRAICWRKSCVSRGSSHDPFFLELHFRRGDSASKLVKLGERRRVLRGVPGVASRSSRLMSEASSLVAASTAERTPVPCTNIRLSLMCMRRSVTYQPDRAVYTSIVPFQSFGRTQAELLLVCAASPSTHFLGQNDHPPRLPWL